MEKDGEIIWIVLVGAVIMLFISVIVIYFVAIHRKKYLTQQNELQRTKNERDMTVLKAILRTQEEERSRIAQNLHDSVGAELSMLQLNLSRHIHFMKPLEYDTGPISEDVKKLDSTIETIRGICHNLYPFTLKRAGFIAALKEVVEKINETGKITCRIEHSYSENLLPDDLEEKVNYLRVCQEILNNILKHAKCTDLTIAMGIINEKLHFQFRHNGESFTNQDVKTISQTNKGIGLSSIKHRIELMEGKIDYNRTLTFSEITVIIPLSHD